MGPENRISRAKTLQWVSCNYLKTCVSQDYPPENLAKGITLGILTVFIGSSVAAVGKHLTNSVDISTIVLAQYLICFICTMPWLVRRGLKDAFSTAHPWKHLIRGITGCACFYAYYIALKHIPLVDASLLRNTAPLIVPIVIFVWFSVAIPKARWLPLIIGFTGVIFALKPGQDGISVWHFVGFLSGAGLAISMVATRQLARTEPESRILFYYFLISLLFAIPFFIYEQVFTNTSTIPASAWPWLLYIGLGMYITFLLYTRAYKYVKASVLSPTSYFAVVFAGVFDWLIWKHIPDYWTLVGIVLIICGSLLILKPDKT